MAIRNPRPNPRGQNSPGGMPNRRVPDGRMPNAGIRGTNTAPRLNNGPAAGRRNPGGRQGPTQQPTPDYFSQLNNFQADIGGEQPGALQAGWGGAGGNLGTMGMTKVNSWLNTFTDPIERAKAMNGIGYNNYSNP